MADRKRRHDGLEPAPLIQFFFDRSASTIVGAVLVNCWTGVIAIPPVAVAVSVNAKTDQFAAFGFPAAPLTGNWPSCVPDWKTLTVALDTSNPGVPLKLFTK